tara:strand:+ start:13712 stop:14134 length:423 start_codon:yes stop_codon:yes gene_type:complete
MSSENKMYCNNTSRSLESYIEAFFIRQKCPISVFMKVWLYIPHNKTPKVSNINTEIYNRVLEINQETTKIEQIIQQTTLSKDKIQGVLDLSGGYRNIRQMVSRMTKDKEYRQNIRKQYHFPIGRYVIIREALKKHNLLIY